MKYKRRASEIRSNIPAVLIAILAIFSVAAITLNSILGGNDILLGVSIGFALLLALQVLITEYATTYEFKEDYLLVKSGLVKTKLRYDKINFQSNDRTKYIYYTVNGKPATSESSLIFPVDYFEFKDKFTEKTKSSQKDRQKSKKSKS